MSTDEQMSKQAQRHNNNSADKNSAMKSEENYILRPKLKEINPYSLTNKDIAEWSGAEQLDGSAHVQMLTDESKRTKEAKRAKISI